MLGTEEGVAKFLPLILDETLRTQVKALFKKHQTSLERWNAFVGCYQTEQQSVIINDSTIDSIALAKL